MARVLIDGENVRRSRWPNVSREELVELVRESPAEGLHDVVIVFDGSAPAGEDPGGVTVSGSGAESADDRLVSEAKAMSGTVEQWLITSDRALRARAEPYVDRVVGGGSFLGELLRG